MNEQNKFITSPFFVFLLALLCAMLWGSSFPMVKYGFDILDIQNNTAGKLYFASYRFFTAGLIMFFFIVLSGKSIFLSSKKDYLYLTIIGLSQTTILYAFFYIGLSNTTGVKASIITSAGSFFLAGASHFLFKNDSLTLRKILGLILGFMGILLININTSLNCSFKLTGELFILLGAIASTFGNIVAKYTVNRVYPPLMCAYQFTIGSIVLFFITFLIEPANALKIPIKAILPLISLSGISATAFSIWYLLIKHNSLSMIAVYRFLIPICGIFFSAIFIKDEQLSLLILLSLLLVCGGMILTSNKKTTKNC